MSDTSFYLIFTDLDGTLLDHDTYSWKEAEPAFDLCKRLRVPVILVSSKTSSEIDLIRRRLSLSYPFISENGGGIFFPEEIIKSLPDGILPEKGLWKWPLGIAYDHLIGVLRQIRNELGWNIRGFSDMTIEEISSLTGLDYDSSCLAANRDFDEPFIVLDQKSLDRKTLFKSAERRGLTITEGGRFFHLKGKSDKGLAMKRVVSWYQQLYGKVFTIALGDSPNDFSMLERADYPVLIRSACNYPGLKTNIPRLIETHETGPRGWNETITDILGMKKERNNV